VYLSNGKLEQITLDDNIISAEISDEGKARIIQKKLNNAVDLDTLSGQEQRFFKSRNRILQALGMEGIKPRMYTIDIHEDDKLIVTLDGIHDNVTDNEISDILGTAQNSQEVVEGLMGAACNRSREAHLRAKADDMSVIVVKILPLADDKEAE
jgi:serine/threonine protein phosphatase PrpC